MALKADRHEVYTDILFYMNETSNRGGLACYSTIGSGAAVDQGSALVTMVVPTSGAKVAGMLLNDMVNVDLTKTHENFHKDVVQQGGKVTLGRVGFWTTDQIASGLTISAGDVAYLDAGDATDRGRITNVKHATGGEAVTPKVGHFQSRPDEDGYAKIWINL
jgi:hypothetical protein